jgi:hypothetical protein
VFALTYLVLLIRQYARTRRIAVRAALQQPSSTATGRPATPPNTEEKSPVALQLMDISQRSLLIFSAMVPLSLLMMAMFELNGMSPLLMHAVCH